MREDMEDNQILQLYWVRSEESIAETERKYGRYCHYIAYQILGDDGEAEEVVNDTYLKIWNSIPPNCPDSLKAYAGMITRQKALDAYEARNAQKRGGQLSLVLDELAECISDGGSSDEIIDGIVFRDVLNRFVRSLPERTQMVFVRRYWYASSVAEIAKAYSMKESAVTVLMFRTRKKLKKFLKKEGIEV